jgi:rubrerythrin
MSSTILYGRQNMAEEAEKEQKPTATKWTCPECSNKLTLFVAPSMPPTCNNPEAHPKKVVQMTPATKR